MPSITAYANTLGAVRSLGLIGYRPGTLVVATDLLVPAGGLAYSVGVSHETVTR